MTLAIALEPTPIEMDYDEIAVLCGQLSYRISDEDKDAIVSELQKKKFLVIDNKGHVKYPG